MEIRNEIKQKNEEKKEFVHRSLADIQRAKLSKLMENPEKPVVIPELGGKKDKEYNAPSFVRNVMGSSAGAGSGEFHVYRHLRRKEYSRQKYMKALTEAERLDQEYQDRLEENRRQAEEKTNKKREKRKKKKKNQRNKGKKTKMEGDNEESEELSEPSDDESEKVDEDSQPATKDAEDDEPVESTDTVKNEETKDETETEKIMPENKGDEVEASN